MNFIWAYLALRHWIVPRLVEDLFDDFFYIVPLGVVAEDAVPLCLSPRPYVKRFSCKVMCEICV